MSSPILVSLDYSKDFLIFYFSSEDTFIGVLLQKNGNNMEQPIFFRSKKLRDAKLKYATMEK